jgi:hypothetical protein
MSDKKVSFNMFYGYTKLDTWFERRGEILVGMGSCTTFDADGKVIDQKIMETGARVYDPAFSISVPS